MPNLEPIPDFKSGVHYANAMIVELKRVWDPAADWELLVGAAVHHCSRMIGPRGVGEAEISLRYGKYKGIADQDYVHAEARDLRNWWVRISLLGDKEPIPIWYGKILNPSRDIMGPDVRMTEEGDRIATGIQTWVAYEPTILLRRQVWRSYWPPASGYPSNEPAVCDWLPDMNDVDGRNLVAGNRSAVDYPVKDDPDGAKTHVYGGSDLWSRYEYLKYTIKRCLGVYWTLGGQADLLASIKDHVGLQSVETVESIVQKLIETKFGLSYRVTVDSDDECFRLEVFTLTSKAIVIEGQTYPANPNVIRVESKQRRWFSRVRLNQAGDHRYRRIRVVGKRIVVLCTLRGTALGQAPYLAGKWPAALETEYQTPTLADPADDADELRKHDRYAPVYARFGIATPWEFRKLHPYCMPNAQSGWPQTAYDHVPRPNLCQSHMLNTLSWLPLYELTDYRTVTPEYLGDSSTRPELRRPFVFLKDEETGKPVLAEAVGIQVGVPDRDLGVYLRSTYNHRVAKRHFDDSQSASPCEYDYAHAYATVAFESDLRSQLVWEMSEADAEKAGIDPDSEFVIEAPHCECWWCAPGTVVDIKPDFSDVAMMCWEVEGEAGKPRLLRRDVEQMRLLLGGAIVRYCHDRARAELQVDELVPWADYLGAILVSVEERGGIATVETPITSIEWRQKAEQPPGDQKWQLPSTTFKTGFAQ